ncbi:hypothetical protein HEQ72_10545 [Haematospirillum sp. 15-248]|uniref:hypothetical protein n=1 Tax=Haematospirillum sp. 15-248 TaxID=2723107 RepID=UPI00143BD798|nr:hypothetical protein [Haematospirillum sp. 15-248]NKD88739.1 hypothetical protein [Haematospirillum sp. 15-248]
MIDPEQIRNVRQAFSDALSLYVGAGRRFSVGDVAAATGVGQDAIRRYLRNESCPEWHNAMSLIRVLPVEFAETVLRPAGLSGVRRTGDETITGLSLMRDITQGAAVLADALADGHIDHQERAVCRTELTKAVVAISQFLVKL